MFTTLLEANTMKMLSDRAVYCILAGLTIFLTTCTQRQPSSPPPPPKVTVSQPVAREVIEWDEYTGRLEAVESVEVRARVSGYLQSVHFTRRRDREKGTVVFRLEPPTASGRTEPHQGRIGTGHSPIRAHPEGLSQSAAVGQISCHFPGGS